VVPDLTSGGWLDVGGTDADDIVVTGRVVEDSAGLKDVGTLTCSSFTASFSVSISMDTDNNLS